MPNLKKTRLGTALAASACASIGLTGLATTAIVLSPAAAGAATSAASICSKVPASEVSAVVGYTVPAPQADTNKLAATKTNFGISSTTTSCIYGSETSLAKLAKVVILEVETTSKAFTPAQFKAELAKVSGDGLKFTVSNYPGFNGTAYFFTFTESNITAEGLSVINGTHGYGSAVESNKLSKAKLAALTKLAASL